MADKKEPEQEIGTFKHLLQGTPWWDVNTPLSQSQTESLYLNNGVEVY
jgi:hypothetical protein